MSSIPLVDGDPLGRAERVQVQHCRTTVATGIGDRSGNRIALLVEQVGGWATAAKIR